MNDDLQQIKPISSWVPLAKKPLIIAGPCSAESPEQLLNIATAIKTTGYVSYLRAGVWKPRTTPNTFEGYGSEALSWLRSIKHETGMPFATEIGNHNHAYEALKFGADMLWIGARTVSNPFAMQEIAEALRGVDIPVLIKNPLSPDLDLWIGAIKRLYNVGIYKLGAIHRGFTPLRKSVFRNQPIWDIPLLLKSKYKNLPVICDPSHIAGKNVFVEQVAQRALSLSFDGLMIETHPYPEIALSDSEQQLNPSQFNNLCELLSFSTSDDSIKLNGILNELRAEIDIIDDMLVWALANRMKIAGNIAAVKQKMEIETIQPNRWKNVMERISNNGTNSGLRLQFLEKIYESIHNESLQIQCELINY